MKKISIIIIVIAVLFLISGVIYAGVFSSGEVSKNNKINYIEKRDYSVVQPASPNSFTSVINPNNFVDIARQIGLDSTGCEVVKDDVNSQFCSAFHNGYQDSKYSDTIAASYKNSMLDQFSMVLYFNADDFNSNKVIDVSNKLLNNFFGTSIDGNNVSTVMKLLEKSMDDKEPVATKEFIVGDFTEQINMQYVKDTQIYVVRYFLILTSEYKVNLK